jgi:hypothetical protein
MEEKMDIISTIAELEFVEENALDCDCGCACAPFWNRASTSQEGYAKFKAR